MRFELGKKQKAEGSGRRYKLELSMIGWIATVAVLLIGVTWVFIFGVLVGRGYRPEQTVPELSRIMPSDKKEQAAGTDNEVLKAEELQFYDSLKEDSPAGKQVDKNELASRTPVKTPEKPAQNQTSQKQAQQKQTAEAKKVEKQPEQTAPKQTAAAPAKKSDLLDPPEPAPTNEPVKTAAAQPKTETSAAATATADKASEDDDQQVYDYVYQVAAFADPKSAETFRGQVVGLGFESHVQESQGEGKTWHRVMVHFQGRPEETRQLKARLAEIGVERTILRQKKPM